MKLAIYKTAKNLLNSLEIDNFQQALEFEKTNRTGKIDISGKEYNYDIYATVFSLGEEVMIVASISLKSFPCNKVENAGYLYKENMVKKYYSQKMLWDYGY